MFIEWRDAENTLLLPSNITKDSGTKKEGTARYGGGGVRNWRDV